MASARTFTRTPRAVAAGAIAAFLALVAAPLFIIIALAAGDPRIQFTGRINDATLLDLYSNALLVAFVPKEEDYGFITIEAFKSQKPVIIVGQGAQKAEAGLFDSIFLADVARILADPAEALLF